MQPFSRLVMAIITTLSNQLITQMGTIILPATRVIIFSGFTPRKGNRTDGVVGSLVVFRRLAHAGAPDASCAYNRGRGHGLERPSGRHIRTAGGGSRWAGEPRPLSKQAARANPTPRPEPASLRRCGRNILRDPLGRGI
jgi:hypothetical protein